MLTVFCFFLPTILYLISIPLKFALSKYRSLDEEDATRKRSLLSRVEDWSQTPTTNEDALRLIGKATNKVAGTTVKTVKTTGKVVYSTAKTAYRAGKMTYTAGKLGVKAVKIAIKASKVVVRATIHLIKLIISVIHVVIVALLSLGVVGIVILVIIAIALIVVLAAGLIVMISSMQQADTDTVASSGGFSGYDYLSIDWSQDFSAKLSEIESTYGSKNRHHAELVILNMRTLQKNSNIKLDPSTWVGIKRIESNTDVFKEDSKSVFTNYSDIYPNDNGYRCFGPYQIQLPASKSSWSAYNGDYTPSDSPPGSDSVRDGTYGNIFFYPDLCLGTNTYYSNMIAGAFTGDTSDGRCYSGIVDDLKACFNELGVEYSDEHAKKVLEFFCANAYNVGHIINLSSNQSYHALAELYIQFFNTYGWERNEAQVNMIKSCVNGGEDSANIYVTTDPQRSWVWGNSASDFDNANSSKVLDASGNDTGKSLYGYLSDGNRSLKSAISSTFVGKTGINEAQMYYGVACYFIGTWEIEKTIDYLGLRSQLKTDGESSSVDGDLVAIIKDACEQQYFSYVLGGDNANQTDCARFVARCLIKAGYDVFGLTASDYSSNNVYDDFHAEANASTGVNCDGEIAWVRANHPEAIIYDGAAGGFDESSLQAGDVCYRGGNHAYFYMGKNSSGAGVIAEASQSGGNCKSDFELTDGGHDTGYAGTGYQFPRTTFIWRPSAMK